MSRNRGFTLVELLIVVAIISVLAVVAGTAYRRYMDSTRSAEVYALFAEFRNKQEAYRAEYSVYVATGANEADFYPVLLGVGKEPSPKTVTRPASWVTLGINPNKRQLYCGFVAQAGTAADAVAGARGISFMGATQTTPWWYMVATCDNDGDGNAGHNAYFVTSSTNTTVFTENEHW